MGLILLTHENGPSKFISLINIITIKKKLKKKNIISSRDFTFRLKPTSKNKNIAERGKERGRKLSIKLIHLFLFEDEGEAALAAIIC
jgi:hypothetical protein